MIKYCFSVSATQGEFGCFFNVRKGSLGIFGGGGVVALRFI